ncbi:uracil-DNA glycosylase family protein [Notoacmeibacter ruber]|uniref:Uracil-DNA glycosylase family protein n=1 Tax=Notoacmeibacter ruber TaxID=2670375 RepID=A0A3L7JLT1_9HYPH|nr:uracil-DNA glycosylase family protein [Notoacmeibacter ruber]RLQ89482.1 uracil-DNA glycosylase family protein [Notoacmeibacter ruber]
MQEACALPECSSLEDYLGRVRRCTICRDDPLGAPLPHEPRPTLSASESATILIAGQAPGLRVHETGQSFNDRSGDRLREWMGINRQTFYESERIAIAAMGFCFPGYDRHGGDLPPRRECAPTWRDGLMARLPNIRLVLSIGLYSQRYHLGALRQPRMTDTVKNWQAILAVTSEEQGRAVIPLPHPSWRNTGWLRKNPWFEAELLPVLRRSVAAELDCVE